MRQRRLKKHMMYNIKIKTTCKIFSIIFLISFMQGCSSDGPDSAKYPAVPDEIGQNLCAIDGRQYGHTVVVIDKTSALNPGQLDFMASHVFGEKFYGSYQPFTKFSYLLIDSTKPTSQKYIWSVCRPKKNSATKYSRSNNNNDELASRDETSIYLESEWKNFMKDSEIIKNKILKVQKKGTSKNSLIYETIIEVLKRPGLDFGDDYPVRNLIIASDLMQSSRRLNFYAECKSSKNAIKPDICPKFNKIEKNLVTEEYISSTTPKKATGDINIKIIYVNDSHQTKASLDETLLALWSSYFNKYGFKTPEINRMVDLN